MDLDHYNFNENFFKIRLLTPRFRQRAKRWYTLFQFPNSAGRSRNGAPERANHIDRFHEKSVAVAAPSTVWRFAWRQVLNLFPLVITQFQASRFFSPKTAELLVVYQLKCRTTDPMVIKRLAEDTLCGLLGYHGYLISENSRLELNVNRS